MHSSDELLQWLSSWQPDILAANERRLVIAEGELSWQHKVAERFFYFYQKKNGSIYLWGDSQPYLPGNKHNYRHQLGRENDLVIFADENFHPDAFAALSGTIKAGGVLLWLKPTNGKPSSFMQRIETEFARNHNVITITASSLPVINPVKLDKIAPQPKGLKKGCATLEQQHAVDGILRVTDGHRNRPLVLTADRGRGKSTALALASAYLLLQATQQQPVTIIICAPTINALNVFFQQLSIHCPQGVLTKGLFEYQQHCVKFIPIDVLLETKPTCQLLLVDEAAAIPVHLLSDVATHYKRIVFSSTQHGYEGAGRGFAIKFQRLLANISPQYRTLHLQQPIRWRENDPLETLIYSTFLFDCQHEPLPIIQGATGQQFRFVTNNELTRDNALLSQVFAVLMSAHYKTTPSDLKLLLDNNAVRIVIGYEENNYSVNAVALIVEEGEASNEDIASVINHEKQLANQFIPQYLLRHLSVENAFQYRYWRVNRIAVTETMQHLGIGSKLLSFVVTEAEQLAIDFVATSFSANQAVVSFWQKNGFAVVNLGMSKVQASGEHAALLLQALNNQAKTIEHALAEQFYRKVAFYLPSVFQKLPASLIRQLMYSGQPQWLPPLTSTDNLVVKAFSDKKMQFLQSAFSLQLWMLHYLTNDHVVAEDIIKGTLFSDAEIALDFMVVKLLQQHCDADICKAFSMSGKKHIQHQLQLLLGNLIC
ncbi:GNAT family N-acetyltransferase [Thalassotalea sp. 1_MG-2023]|uniref:GNAT family N-acetyltransferase n=1 Tax=Thalassotalea sp. 1_MG-2023 TaxID=3062680 RepID=UPI0026E3F3B9|nr:GNAT family N-acetyltransferase [Thalassotalea sp. 1_MG-2023]MDO6428102.1 GNAT family N-acetyltransferase [Thalassotalea sp. 1_MG-2023]